MEFPGRNILFVIVVGLLVVPLQVTLIPVLNLFRDFTPAGIKINGTMLAVWLAHTGYGLPFAIYLLRNYFGSLPREVFESAAIDGASPSTSFFRLALPMSVPALASLIIFQFLWVWNDLLVALVFLGPGAEVRVMPTALFQLMGSRGGSWHLLTAGAFVTMVVPLTVFLVLQRAFVRGILAGSVKS
jgi:alpha-glucoside transport system permease protein